MGMDCQGARLWFAWDRCQGKDLSFMPTLPFSVLWLRTKRRFSDRGRHKTHLLYPRLVFLYLLLGSNLKKQDQTQTEIEEVGVRRVVVAIG